MFEKIPFFIPKIYPERVWRIPSEEKKIYLTFDDGPIPEVTPWVLEQLRKFSAKATFFCIGENIQKYPGLFQQIISEGHAIGNHTQNHLNGWRIPVEEYVKNVFLAEKAIEGDPGTSGKLGVERENKTAARGKRKEERGINFSIQNSKWKIHLKKTTNHKPQTTNSKLFRPPYGKLTGRQAKQLRHQGYQIVMWDVLSRDYDAKVSASHCLKYILKNAASGSIIVFHDSLKAERNLRNVLSYVLQHYSKLEYTFEKLN